MSLLTETGSLADNPDDVATTVNEAAIDGKNQLHYIAGNHATSAYNWLQKEAVEMVMKTMKKRFLK